ncbi:uncharacterized protein [Clytia hemisphaerica]|uniref:LicD/FKTN/FKRP nucleotidyltransferase domain-containing protein n=1 Tax=Clytia hemisphaerica TaxID=252671 RepID=A0A7M5XG59_9CNID|eukprot:TCONS_00011501-protein
MRLKESIGIAILLLLGFYFFYSGNDTVDFTDENPPKTSKAIENVKLVEKERRYEPYETKKKVVDEVAAKKGTVDRATTSLHDSLVFPSTANDFTSKLEYAYSKSGQDLKVLQKEVEERRSKLVRSPLYGEDQSCKNNDRIAGLTKLFDAWAHMAKLFNIEYFLTYGSLIGAERDRNIIPYDLDTDIMMPEDDVPKLQKMIDDNFSVSDNKIHLRIHPEYKTHWRKRTKICCNGQISRGPSSNTCWDQCAVPNPLGRLILGPVLHIGITGYKVIKNHTVLKMTCHEEYGFKTEYSWKDLAPRDCEFLGHKTYCPTNANLINTEVYGEYWTDPHKKCINGVWTKTSRPQKNF